MKKHILIVDDEPGVAFFLAENLTDLGPDYVIKICHSGADALAMSAAYSFDLAIIDWMMPGLSGLQLASILKERQPDMLLVLMTAYGNDVVETKARELGLAGYVTKPFEIEEMLMAVQNLLENGASPHESGESKPLFYYHAVQSATEES